LSQNDVKLQLPRGKNSVKGKFNGMAPSRGNNSASGTLLRLKLTEDIEQKLRKTIEKKKRKKERPW